MKLDVLFFSTRSPALYVGGVEKFGLRAGDDVVAELHVIGRVLGEEVVPAILVVIRAALIRIWARIASAHRVNFSGTSLTETFSRIL